VSTLEIRDLHVSVEGAADEILKGVDLTIESGQTHAIMGPNGFGQVHPGLLGRRPPEVRGDPR